MGHVTKADFSANDITRAETKAAFLRAIDAAGSQVAVARACGVSKGLISHWVNDVAPIHPVHFPAIESATGGRVTCEEMRPDLHWIRDNGIVVGYITPLDGNEPAYVAQCLRNGGEQRQPEWMDGAAHIRGDVGISDELGMLAAARRAFPTLSPLYQGYVAGMLHGWGEAAVEEVERQFRGTHAHEWDATAVGLLFDAAERASNDRAFHFAYGMLYDFTDQARDDLFDRFRVHDFQHWDTTKNAALWEEAQRIRREHPEQLDPSRALVAQPAPSTAPHGACLNVHQHKLRVDDRTRMAEMHGCNVNWQHASDATLDDAMNDVTGFLNSAIAILTNDSAVELNATGWSAVHLLCLALALQENVHSTLLQLPRSGASA